MGKYWILTDIKKQTTAVDIISKWGKDIIEEGDMSVMKKNDRVINYLRGGTRMDQGWWCIVFLCLLSMVMKQVYSIIL